MNSDELRALPAVVDLRTAAAVLDIGRRLQQRTYETDDGRKRSTIELVADEVSVSLRHAIVRAVPSRGHIKPGRLATTPPESTGRALP